MVALSWLRYARHLSFLAFALAPVFINDYQVEDYKNETIKFVISNVLKPYKDWGWYLLIGGIGAYIISEIGFVVKKRYIDRVKCENCKREAEADYKWRLSQLLKRISCDLKLDQSTQRVSVYKHDKETNQFIMLGRYSSNPTYSNDGRVCYPDNEGVISMAWKEGEAILEISSNPRILEKYCSEHYLLSSIPKDVVKKFAMKSVYYSGHAVSDVRGDRIAVVIWESTRKIKTTIRTHEQLKVVAKDVSVFIVDNAKTEPSLSFAREESL